VRALAVIWRSGELLMAIDARSVVEVLPPVSCRAAPGTPGWVRGLFAYRGALIPLVDAGSLLGMARGPDRMCNRVIVVRVAVGSGALDWPVGVWVESVLEIERTDFGGVGGHSGFATEAGRFLGPVVQSRWGQVQLVRPEEIFTLEQAAIMTQRLAEAAA
jgi:chemotaxis-related protein WspB